METRQGWPTAGWLGPFRSPKPRSVCPWELVRVPYLLVRSPSLVLDLVLPGGRSLRVTGAYSDLHTHIGGLVSPRRVGVGAAGKTGQPSRGCKKLEESESARNPFLPSTFNDPVMGV